MPRPSKQTYPDWVLPYKTKGREIKLINGGYYLYQISSKYDKETKKRIKTSKYLGVITQTEGLRETKAGIIERLSSEGTDFPNGKSVRDYEAGVSEFFLKHMSGCASLLQKHFPQHWQTVIALAYNRLVYEAPLKDTWPLWRKSYLSEFYKDVPVDEEAMIEVLEEIGREGSRVLAFYKEFQDSGDAIMFVGKDISSSTYGRDKFYWGDPDEEASDLDKDASTIWIFSISEFLPIYYRNIPYKIEDIESLKISMEEFGDHDCVCLVDHEKASHESLGELKKYGIRFLVV